MTTAAGSTIAVGIVMNSAVSAFISSVVDSKGNSYAPAIARDTESACIALYYKENVGAGAQTVTVSKSGYSSQFRVIVFEVTGTATASSADGTGASANDTGTTHSTGAATLTYPTGGDLLIGFASSYSSYSGGWTTDGWTTAQTASQVHGAWTTASAGSQSFTPATGNSVGTSQLLFAFTDIGAGGTEITPTVVDSALTGVDAGRVIGTRIIVPVP